MPNFLAVAGPQSRWKESGAKSAGFWAGFWHGLISPLTFLVSLITPAVRIYETNNRGRFYEFGFMIGVSAAFGGGSSTVGRNPM